MAQEENGLRSTIPVPDPDRMISHVARLSLPVALLSAIGLVWTASAQDDSEAACERALETLREDYLNRRFEGPDTRSELLDIVRRFQAQHDGASRCVGQSRDPEVVLLLLDGRIGPADSVLTATIAASHFESLPPGIQSRLLYNQAYVYDRLGRWGDAASFYYRAASLGTQMPAHEAVRATIAASSIAMDLQDFATATFYLDLAGRILRDSTLAPEHERVDHASFHIQHALMAQRQVSTVYDSEKRAQVYRRIRAYADSAYRRLQGGTTDDEIGRAAIALFHRARAETRLGLLDRAEQSAQAAWPLIPGGSTVFDELEHTGWAVYRDLHEATGDLDAALAASLRAEQAVVTARSTEVRWLSSTTTSTGDLYTALGRLDDAEASYRRAIQLAEVERGRIGLSDWTSSSFAGQQAPHRALARLLADQGRTWDALQALDATRGRTYRDLRESRGALRRLRPAEYERVSALADSLAALRLELATSTSATLQSERIAAIASLQDSIQVQLGGTAKPARPLDLNAVQRSLREEGRVLLTYLFHDDGGLAFVLRGDTLAAVPLTATLDSVRARSDRLTRGWMQETPDPAFAQHVAEQLYADLIGPVALLLPLRAPLTIIPDAAVAQIPFPALIAPHSPDGEATYLVRQHAVTTDLSIDLATDTTHSTSRASLDVLAFGRSTFDASPPGDLPFVPAEIQSIETRGRRTRTALDGRATEAALVAAMPQARIVHIASHAFVDPAIPFNSRILLSDDPDTEDDGTLYLYELQNASLDADLVVLSGCSTARGVQHRGEGMIGLQYGVRVAGARAALATLWPVDDRATVELMDAFYDALGDGMSKDRALQHAQLAYLDGADARSASPFFWAGAVLSGDPSPVPIGRGAPLWIWGFAIAALAVAGRLVWRFRPRTPA